MKKSMLAVSGAFLLLLVLVSCHHDPVEPVVDPVGHKILGKWKLLRYEEEYYQPVNVLSDHLEYPGQPEDSLVFSSQEKVYAYSALGTDEFTYKLVNDSTINIDDEPYKIRKLTNTEFNLYYEETDPAADEKYVTRILLYR